MKLQKEMDMSYFQQSWRILRFMWIAGGLFLLGRDKSIASEFRLPTAEAACGHCQGVICYPGQGAYCDYTGGSCQTSGKCC
jgi:hypothetical protein